jgi:glutaredoxin-like YruB-family protein
MSVVIYTTPTCGYCQQVKNYLSRRGVSYVERDLSRDPGAAAEMVRLTGQQGVPVTVIDGQPVLGADMQRIDQLLAQLASHPPRLGVSIAAAARIAEKKGIRLPEGAYVGRVKPYSSGALAGLRVGDVITQLGGQPVRSDQDVHAIMARQRYGQAINVLAWRNGQTIGMQVQF